jgi:hypothetical protein
MLFSFSFNPRNGRGFLAWGDDYLFFNYSFDFMVGFLGINFIGKTTDFLSELTGLLCPEVLSLIITFGIWHNGEKAFYESPCVQTLHSDYSGLL